MLHLSCQLESLLTVDGHLRVEVFCVTAYALWGKNMRNAWPYISYRISMIGLGI